MSKIAGAPPGCSLRVSCPAQGRLAQRSLGCLLPSEPGEEKNVAWLGLGTLSRPPFAVLALTLGKGPVGQDTWRGFGSPAQALFSRCPKGERGISLMQNKEACPFLFPGMHFSLNNEVTNIECLANVRWLWWAAAAWLHEHSPRLCWFTVGHCVWLFLKKISKLFYIGKGWLFCCWC